MPAKKTPVIRKSSQDARQGESVGLIYILGASTSLAVVTMGTALLFAA